MDFWIIGNMFMKLQVDTYELLATQWAAVMTHESEISDPPQVNPPLRFRAIC